MSIYQEVAPFPPTYLYIKQHTITGLLYFGKTVSINPIKYPGSGTTWKRHIKKHGKEHIETLWYCLFYDAESISSFALMCSEQWNIVNAKDENGKKIWANLKYENGLDGTIPGSKHSDIHKLRISKSLMGVSKIRIALTTDETRIKQSKASLGKKKSKEHAKNISLGLTGLKRSDAFNESEAYVTAAKANIKIATAAAAIANKGTFLWNNGIQQIRSKDSPGLEWVRGWINPPKRHSPSEETLILLRKPRPHTKVPKQKVTCPHCGKCGGLPVMMRYHFNKCKLKNH